MIIVKDVYGNVRLKEVREEFDLFKFKYFLF